MPRNLTALGLAAVAVLAINGMAASAAHAATPVLTLETGGTRVDMRTGSTPGVFSRLGRTVSCKTADLSAPAGNLAETLTMDEIIFGSCESPSLKKPATVFMNGCRFTVHLTEHDPGFPEIWTGSTDLECTAPSEVTVAIYNDAAHKEVLCLFHIPTQTNKTKVELTNRAAGTVYDGVVTSKQWVEAHIALTGIANTKTTGTIATCGGANDATGTLTATAEIYGTNGVLGETGVTISTN